MMLSVRKVFKSKQVLQNQPFVRTVEFEGSRNDTGLDANSSAKVFRPNSEISQFVKQS